MPCPAPPRTKRGVPSFRTLSSLILPEGLLASLRRGEGREQQSSTERGATTNGWVETEGRRSSSRGGGGGASPTSSVLRCRFHRSIQPGKIFRVPPSPLTPGSMFGVLHVDIWRSVFGSWIFYGRGASIWGGQEFLESDGQYAPLFNRLSLRALRYPLAGLLFCATTSIGGVGLPLCVILSGLFF